jgi:hypothetical protein
VKPGVPSEILKPPAPRRLGMAAAAGICAERLSPRSQLIATVGWHRSLGPAWIAGAVPPIAQGCPADQLLAAVGSWDAGTVVFAQGAGACYSSE